ncbi:MAG: alpha/beta hydrolase [Hyphomicrobiales bacterium]|nr:MAG: alpha/beta hydrolase [Hyphomicrobiales bacterium]
MPRLEVRLLGFPALSVDGERVGLALRKGLALLAYLADTRAPVSRDQVAALLWPDADPEASRSRLRRTLHKINAAFPAALVQGDRTTLALSAAYEIRVDTHAFEAACAAGDLDEGLRLYAGDFLQGLVFDEDAAFDEWAFFRREALRSKLVQALERLIERTLQASDGRGAVAAATRLVALDPLSESAQRYLIAAHLSVGDRAAAERQFAAFAKLLDAELGIAPSDETRAQLDAVQADTEPALPRTRYAERGGIHIAYQVVGSGPFDIVLVPGFVSHVERIWDEPRCRALLDALSRMGRLILFDRRGVGLSDRVGAAPTVAATAEDLLTVIDAAACKRVVLIGASEGGPGCIHFAALHPERLAGLVLYGSLAKGSWAPDYPHVLKHAQYEAWLQRLVRDWGGAAEMATFAPSLAGDGQAERWWAGLLRAASSPGAIRSVLEALRDTDVRPLLARVTTPTLVLHRRGDMAVRIEAGRDMARSIKGARFVELDGADHWLWAGDTHTVLDTLQGFMRTLPAQKAVQPARRAGR